jgi:hypothetical protein
MHVTDVACDERGRLLLTVEADQVVTGCASFSVVAIGHGRRVHRARDARCLGRTAVVRWPKRALRVRRASLRRQPG